MDEMQRQDVGRGAVRPESGDAVREQGGGVVRKRKRHERHGASPDGAPSPEYRCWAGIVQRTTNPKNSRYHYYGGRGVTMCTRWRESFSAFLADMGPKPSPEHSIDRIDGSLGYTPENCRWVGVREQRQNRSTSIFLTAFGETHCIAEWARRRGINLGTLYSRLNREKWSIEKALTHPLRVYRTRSAA